MKSAHLQGVLCFGNVILLVKKLVDFVALFANAFSKSFFGRAKFAGGPHVTGLRGGRCGGGRRAPLPRARCVLCAACCRFFWLVKRALLCAVQVGGGGRVGGCSVVWRARSL